MDEDDFWELLTFFKALDPEVIFHEPINPRGENFQMCLNAVEEAGYERVADELHELLDHQNWVKYALEQINMVQQVADEIGGIQVHSWPDRELVNSTSGQLRRKLQSMQRAASPESFVTQGSEGLDAHEAQSQLAEDSDAIRELVL